MLKAEGGGGGRGIFLVREKSELEDAFLRPPPWRRRPSATPACTWKSTSNRSATSKSRSSPTSTATWFAFDERDCSVQRNHQKLVEITPSPWAGITPELRERLKEYSRMLVREVGYYSLATVEFLVTPQGEPYLIEVNTRLQVEHGITESRYGVDLVEEQIAVAFGAKLRLTEENTKPSHFAMQVRINCEDPQNNFAPNSGLITRYVSPGGPGVRIDSNLSAGYEFPPNYDSAGSLLIAYGRDWQKVLGIMDRALTEYMVGGVKTTIPFYRQVLKHPAFRAGMFDTGFIPSAPELMIYADLAPESERLAKLIAEISAKGYNPSSSSANTVPTPRPACRVRMWCSLPSPPKYAKSPLPIRTATAWPCSITSATAAVSTSRTRPPATAPNPTAATASASPKTASWGPTWTTAAFSPLRTAAARTSTSP